MFLQAFGKYNRIVKNLVDWLKVKRYLRLFALYIAIAVAVVLLYAPWGLALRPTDYSLLRAGLSIIGAIALAGTFGAGTYLALKDPDEHLLAPAEVVDEDEVIPVLRDYVETPYVGGIAADVIEQVQSSDRKRRRLQKYIGQQFSEGSITWDRFAGLVDQAHHTIIRNAALVANNVQTFDREGYAKDLADLRRRDNELQRQQIAVYEQSLAHMREIIAANERMLLELGKLELELSKLDAGSTLESNEGTIDELTRLIEETKYYG